MEIESLAKSLLHKWKIELKSKDRSKPNIASNFDELIDGWKMAGVPREMASDLMDSAVKEHFPPRNVIRMFYKRNKYMLNDTTEEEYTKNWQDLIEGEAYQVFYLYYPLQVKSDKPKVTYGSMSKQEHMRQVSYANSHPDVDINEIIKKRKQSMGAVTKVLDVSSVMVDLETL